MKSQSIRHWGQGLVLTLVLAIVAVPPSRSAAEDIPPAANGKAWKSGFPKIDALIPKKRYKEMLEAATKAAKENPKSARTHQLIGRAHFYMEHDSEAIAAFTRAITLAPKYPNPRFFRGLVYMYKKDLAKSVADFEAACRLAPKEELYHFELGRQRARAGDYSSAVKAMQTATKLNPNNARAHFDLGTYYSSLNQNDEAVAEWKRTLKLAPKHADAHYNLGTHNYLRGSPQKALSHFRSFQKLMPKEVTGYTKTMQAYYLLEKYKKASAYRAKLLQLVASSPIPQVRNLKEFCFDQFDVEGGRFFAYESVEKTGNLVYWYTFKLVRNNRVVKTINIETSAVLKEMGGGFIVGQNEGGKHTTFAVSLEKLPPYPNLKKLILKAHQGKLPSSASSTQ